MSKAKSSGVTRIDTSSGETNGNVYMVGSVVAFIGAWNVWSFSVALFGLGVSWMAIAIFSSLGGGD